jgi:hypothetical protein
MLPPVPAKSPYAKPTRRLCAGLYYGIAPSEPTGVTMSIAPPHGELLLREDHAVLPNGRVVIALGDAHSVVDPVVGQGANSASYSAFELGAVIAEDPNFDERFAQKVAARRANRVQAISNWTNLMIGLPPAPHLLQLLGAMSQNPAVADEFTDNFNQPERQWDILATPERTTAFLARHGM